MNTIKNFFIFCGIQRDDYYKIRTKVSEENRKIGNVFMLLVGIVFCVVGIISSKNKDLVSVSVLMHLIPGIISLLMWLINLLVGKKLPILSDAFALIFIACVLGSSLAIGITQSTDRTTLLLPIYGFAALVFAFRIIYLGGLISITEIVYIVLALNTQKGNILFVNIINTIIFAVLGLCIGSYSMMLKYKKYLSDYNNKFLSERDVLTKLFNRFCYEKKLEELDASKKPFILYLFDINGLKKLNDTKGHKAGDELIIGAATCIKKVFGPYGTVYRIGGDEFVAILEKEHPSCEELNELFDNTTAEYRSNLVKLLSVSYGCVRQLKEENKSINEILNEADTKMYIYKRKYHELNDK